MNKKGKANLESGVSLLLTDLPNYDGSNEDEIKKRLALSRFESKYIHEEEDAEIDLKVKEEKLKLEKEKFTYEKRLNNDKLELDKLKLELERDRLAFDREVKLEELKRSASEKRLNTILRAVEIGLPIACGFTMFMVNARLVYVDDGRLPSEMRDLWNKVFRMK